MSTHYMVQKFTSISFLSVLILILCACTPETRYYRLVPVDTQPVVPHLTLSDDFTLGLGPIFLPDELDREGVLSYRGGTQVVVAEFNLWSGDPGEQFIHILRQNLSRQLNMHRVHSFPWDTRHRPEHQIRLNVERFAGEIGGDSELQIIWTLFSNTGKTEVFSRQKNYRCTSQDDEYQGYIAALSECVGKLANDMAKAVAQYNQTLTEVK